RTSTKARTAAVMLCLTTNATLPPKIYLTLLMANYRPAPRGHCPQEPLARLDEVHVQRLQIHAADAPVRRAENLRMPRRALAPFDDQPVGRDVQGCALRLRE